MVPNLGLVLSKLDLCKNTRKVQRGVAAPAGAVPGPLGVTPKPPSVTLARTGAETPAAKLSNMQKANIGARTKLKSTASWPRNWATNFPLNGAQSIGHRPNHAANRSDVDHEITLSIKFYNLANASWQMALNSKGQGGGSSASTWQCLQVITSSACASNPLTGGRGGRVGDPRLLCVLFPTRVRIGQALLVRPIHEISITIIRLTAVRERRLASRCSDG